MPGSKSSSGASPDAAWLLYDADCGLCKFVVARVLEIDRARRLRPIALQDPRAAELLPGLSEEERMRSFHLVEADGSVHSAGDGLAGLFPPLGRAPRLASRLYWLVAGNRDRLGRLLPDFARSQADRRIRARTNGH